jgi:hypothetical protein
MIASRHVRHFAFAAAFAAAGGFQAATAPAEAQHHRRHHRPYYAPGAAVGLGIAGGLVAGSIIAGAARPAPIILDEPVPDCWYESRRVWDVYGYRRERVRVCE